MKRLKVVIFGLGAIGRRHAQILRTAFPCEVYAFRSKASDRKKGRLGIPEIHRWEQVRALKPDVAFITNPTFLHVTTARACASLGMHLFIEKPLANSLKGLDALEEICRRKKLTCYTAYCLRFHPVIKELHRLIKGKNIYHVRIVCSSHLSSWRKGTDSRDSYSGIANQGGGVLLDLSHEFDYIKFLFGDIKMVTGIYGKAASVSLDSEDFADVLLTAGQAPHINLHLNFLSRMDERRVIIDYEGGCLAGNLVANNVEIYAGGKKKIKRFKVTREDYLKEQTQYFLKNLGNPLIMNNLKEARATLSEILEFKKKFK